MMTDQDIQTLYKANLGISESAALRGVFDAGYQFGIAQAATPQTVDESSVVTLAQVLPDVVNVTTI